MVVVEMVFVSLDAEAIASLPCLQVARARRRPAKGGSLLVIMRGYWPAPAGHELWRAFIDPPLRTLPSHAGSFPGSAAGASLWIMPTA